MDLSNHHDAGGSQRQDRSSAPLNAEQLSAIARTLYTEGPFLLRTLQHWRPYICPFENLVGHVQDGSRVLDIGCGAGLLLGLVAGIGREFEGVGFDVSQPAIDVARSMVKRAALIAPKAKLTFECLQIEDAWPEGKFHVVFLVDVLHHVPAGSQRPFLRQVISKVKPGGVLIYKDMCMRPWWKSQANRLHDLVVARQLLTYAPVQAVEQWANEEGMRVILREDISRFCYGHELRMLTASD